MSFPKKRYPLHQCALYAIKSPAQLAEVLGVSPNVLSSLLASSDNYIRFQVEGRQIQEPKPLLKRVHKRAAMLLGRVETPDYLHSATKGRSYITNADVHRELAGTIKLDVKKFYFSARAQAVFHFFIDRLHCARDVAGMLTKLLTVDGHLPTGGNASPILSFWAYRGMFDDVNQLSERNGAVFSTYVDDMAITGEGAKRSIGFEARKIVGSYRLKSHKARDFRPGQTKIVTGVALTRIGRKLPLRRQQMIAQDYARLAAATSAPARLVVLHKLISRVCEASQVDPIFWKPKAAELLAFRRQLQQQIASARRSQPLNCPRLVA